MTTLGHLRPNYAERRLVIGKVPGIEYIEVTDRSRQLAHLASRINGLARCPLLSPVTAENLYFSHGIRGADLLHLVNAISFGPIPWISTFETMVPRFAGNLVHADRLPSFRRTSSRALNRLAVSALASRQCLGLVALSDCALCIEKDFLSHAGRAGEKILAKARVLRPPQPLHPVGPAWGRVPSPGSTLRFMFVGSSFIRKGGRELLAAMLALRGRPGLSDFHLTIVSGMNVDSYATGESEKDMEDMKAIIAANSVWITWHSFLPNEAVIDLMRHSDIGLLPTHADTYGYSVLEFQSCGVPVVSTDIRALPEINDNECGWLIPVTKNRFGEGRYDTATERRARSNEILTGLIGVLEGILRDPLPTRRKGELARSRIRSLHDPVAYARALKEVYEPRTREILGRTEETS